MKRKTIYSPILFVFLLVLILSGCKNPAKDITVTFNTSSLYKSPLLVRFENANPNSTKSLGDFKISISGKDSALVQMGPGVVDFKALQGTIPLALRAQAKPSEKNPLTFVVNASIAGYEPIHKTVTITTDSSLVLVIPAYDLIKKVNGSAFLTEEHLLKAGVTTAPISLSTPTSTSMAEKVTINIPQGTEMRDASNVLINADMLKTTLIAYNTSATASAELGIGGAVERNAIQNGAYIPYGVNFVPAGALHLTMYAGNKVVGNFSKPLEVSQELPAGLINYETKAAVKAGEVIPLWYKTVANGEFRLMTTNATITTGTGGKLVAKYTITTPNVWNLSWGWSPTKADINKELTINFTSSHSPFTGTYFMYIYNSSGIFLRSYWNYQPSRDFFQVGKIVNNTTTFSTTTGKYGYSLPSFADASSARILVYSNTTGKLVGQSAFFTPATTPIVNINIDNSPVVVTPPVVVPPPAPIEYVNITASFTGKCVSKNIVAPLSSWITINDVTDNKFIYVYIKNGVIDNATQSIQLIVGHQFKISSNYQGTAYTTGTFPVKKATIVIPAAAENFSATSTYNEATNTLHLTGLLTQECK